MLHVKIFVKEQVRQRGILLLLLIIILITKINLINIDIGLTMQVNEHILASISPYLIISLRGVTNPYSFKRLSSY